MQLPSSYCAEVLPKYSVFLFYFIFCNSPKTFELDKMMEKINLWKKTANITVFVYLQNCAIFVRVQNILQDNCS